MSQESTVPSSGSRLDLALSRAATASGAPGVQTALVHRGDVVWTGRYGVADRVTGTPVIDETVFSLASLGKTLVAALCLIEVEKGRLDLDAPVADVLDDDLPGFRVVTPRMLLTHTSGYPDLYETPEVAALMPRDEDLPGSGSAYDPDRPFTWQMLAPGIRQPVEPGARWEYSNAGYIVLTRMLVRTLGGDEGLAEAWAALAALAGGDRLTDHALTMHRSRVRPELLSHGYREQPDGTLVDVYAVHAPAGVPTDLFGLPFGDGLFAGTAVGAAMFLDGLFVRAAVLDPATLDLMTTTTPQAAAAIEEVPEPALATYGMGTFRMEAAGGTWWGHRGTYGGFNVIAMSDAERGDTLAVLTNVMGAESRAVPIWHELAEALDAPDVTAVDAAGSARTR